MSRRRLQAISVLLTASTAVAGCGGGEPRRPPTPSAAAPHQATRPDEVRCRQLKTPTAARKLARKLVDRVVAPEDQSERRTIGIIGESLFATCRQPRLPGVRHAADYKPVRPVLAQIQHDFDEDEISGG